MSTFLKGKILEYLTRKILTNCGFTPVVSDGLYIYDSHPLQMINGKGAAHDADVLMNPPIQMPFSYPTRILFECKAYATTRKVGVNIVRGAAGLRNDINDFEIITEDFLHQRKNNRRTILAVSDRKRHFYQIGIVTLFEFSKPALEFAANNKIPLLSINELFSDSRLASLIDGIDPDIENVLGPEVYKSLTNSLSKKNVDQVHYSNYISNNRQLFQLMNVLESEIQSAHVGVLESGELLFLKKQQRNGFDILASDNISLTAKIHWHPDKPDRWWFNFNNQNERYYFYLPKQIALTWKLYDDKRHGALTIKGEKFARFFIFKKDSSDESLPFKLVKLNKSWLDQILNDQQGENPR